MPVIFGEPAGTVDAIVRLLKQHGDALRDTYRARYRYDASAADPYAPPVLERPEGLRGNPPDVVYPWEQVFVAAATCAGSDYPMLAAHAGVPLARAELVVEGLFDPRGEFEGLDSLEAPADARHCFLALHLRATLWSAAPRPALETIHARVLARNMVLGALRGIPRTDELVIVPPD